MCGPPPSFLQLRFSFIPCFWHKNLEFYHQTLSSADLICTYADVYPLIMCLLASSREACPLVAKIPVPLVLNNWSNLIYKNIVGYGQAQVLKR